MEPLKGTCPVDSQAVLVTQFTHGSTVRVVARIWLVEDARYNEEETELT